VIEAAGSLAASHALRGYDAVHCASAMAVFDIDLVGVAGDRCLLDAWHDLGLRTLDVNA
jgi:uncharacterized protein